MLCHRTLGVASFNEDREIELRLYVEWWTRLRFQIRTRRHSPQRSDLFVTSL